MNVMLATSVSEVNLLSVGKVSPDNQRNFLLIEFLESNLKRIGLAFKINQDRSIHTENTINTSNYQFATDLKDGKCTNLI